MFWYGLGVIGVFASVLGYIIYHVYKNKCYSIGDFVGVGMMTMGIVLIIFIGLYICTERHNNQQAMSAFLQQKEYIESQVSENETEDTALTLKKVELNQWLFEVQYTKENYSIFSLYPDEILEYEPVE